MTYKEAIAYGKRVIDLGLNDETQAFCELAIHALKWQDFVLNGDACATCKHGDISVHDYPCIECVHNGLDDYYIKG